mgnify:CR=1 FL=1
MSLEMRMMSAGEALGTAQTRLVDVVDSLLGLEYDAGCWIGRIAFERKQSTVSTATSRLLFQLEFIGLARVGASPLSALRNNIPRYQNLRDNFVAPSRFQNYE